MAERPEASRLQVQEALTSLGETEAHGGARLCQPVAWPRPLHLRLPAEGREGLQRPAEAEGVWKAWEGRLWSSERLVCALKSPLITVETCFLFNSISKKSKSLNNLHPERKGSWL